MEFRALGSLSVRRDGKTVALGGPKQRMVLAVLLLRANQPVSVDRLIDGIWGENPPSAGRHTLHGYVSELRKVLEGQPAREGSGYVLQVAATRFDVARFEDLTAEGRNLMADNPARAAELLAEGLSLWEGTPYADLADEPALDGEIRRLSELRLQAVENRVDADLAMGRHQSVTTELEALTREYPFRERLWSQLMTALYRSGRQAEALRTYRRIRELLADELGIDPSSELQALEQQILDHDQALAWANPFPAPAARPGHRSVGGYELRQVIGEGDFGTVYQAYQPSVGRQVALKIVRPEYANSPNFVRQFEAEAQFVARLEHPHIVPLYDYWRGPEGAYLVMPYLRGGSLATALRRGPWNAGPALQLLDQVGSALSHAHRQGVVHRDVKPANVLLDSDGNAYLSDFGISIRLTDAVEAPLTSSLGYLPPEELRGEPLTAASDIFSLAILTFELFTGVRPTAPGGLPIAEVRPDLPTELAKALGKATEDQPALRHERVEDFLREIRQAMGADVVAVPSEPAESSEAPIRNPYKGLRAFQETDAADFHGRHGLVDQLLQAISQHRLVGVVGPSGSGKSSVIRAGLIPALRAGALPGSRGWLITDMFPGSYPFEELETALLRVSVDDPGGLIEELRIEERGLMRVIKRILPTDDSELVLIIDQFEELFSMVDDEETRRLLLDALTTLVTDERSRVRVVMTLRADFFDRPLEYPVFGGLLREGLVTVTAPDDEALALAISRPARGVGLDLEPGLAGEIVNDIRDQPGGLPLLQYALTELFHRREGRMLTIAGYRQSGGVAGALGRRAEELYVSASEAGQEAVHQLFLRLVSVDEQTDDTRRRVRQTELEALDVDQPALQNVVRQFGSYRLLTFDRDPITRSPTLEVAHEALIREWARLRGWIDEQRESLVLHRRFNAALQDWENAGEADVFLLSGGRLIQFDAWAKTTRLSLTAAERSFLNRSRDEETRRRRQRAILRWGAAAVLATLATVAFAQSRIAQREARQATVRELAGQSALALDEDPERAILLALEAVDISRRVGEEVLPEAIGALQHAVQTSRLELVLTEGFGNIAVSPDGSLLAGDSLNEDIMWTGNDVVIWDAATGDRLRTLRAEKSVSAGNPKLGFEGGRSLAFSPNGELLAAAYEGEGEVGALIIWNPHTGEEIARPIVAGSVTWNPTWSSDGDRLIVASSDGETDTINVWDMPTGRQVAAFQPGHVGEIDLYDDETVIVTHGPAERVGFYDLETGEEVGVLDTPGLPADYLAIDRHNHRIAVSARHLQLQVWDLESRSLLWSRPISSSRRIVVSPNGEIVALTGAEGLIRLLDLDDGSELVELAGHAAATGDVAFTPTGNQLVSMGNDGEGRVWDVSPAGPPVLGAVAANSGRPYLIDFSPDGSEVGFSTWDGTFERHNLSSGQLLGVLDGLITDAGASPVVSPNWEYVAAVTTNGEATVWDLGSLQTTHVLPPCTNPRAFTPDGSALLLDGGWLCPPADAPEGVELRSRVLDLESGEELFDLGEQLVFRAAFSPGGSYEAGRFMAVNIGTQYLDVYDMASHRLLASLEIFPTMLRFDPTGRYLASGTLDGGVVVLDLIALMDGESVGDALVMEATVATGGVPGIALTANGVLATAAFDSSFIRLWNIHPGELLAELRTGLDGSSPPQLNFSPGGSYLLYPDAGNVLRRFYLDTDSLVELARSRLTRDFTDEECRRFLDPVSCG